MSLMMLPKRQLQVFILFLSLKKNLLQIAPETRVSELARVYKSGRDADLFPKLSYSVYLYEFIIHYLLLRNIDN